MFHALGQDTRCLLALIEPGRPVTFLALARLWFVSRGLWLLAAHRLAHHCERPRPLRARLPLLAAEALVALTRPLTIIVNKCEITPETPLEPGVVLSDRGYIILGARFVGSGTVIDERTTIGMNVRPELKPWIGRDVWIGSHCIVYGDIRIGDGATILPHTVLTRNVPAGAIVEGNPARLAGNERDHATLRRRHFGMGGKVPAHVSAESG